MASISCTYEAAWYTNYGSTVDICAPAAAMRPNFVNLISYDEGYNLSTIPTNLQNGDSFVYTYANGETETKTIDYVSSTVGYGLHDGNLDGLSPRIRA